MDIGVVLQQTLLSRMVEISPMVDASLLAWSTTKDLRPPGIKMRVKVNNRNWTISTIHRPQQRKRNRMITAQSNHTRQSLAMLAGTRGAGIGGRLTHQDAVVALFDLLDGPLVVVARYWDVSAVDHCSPAVERVGVEGDVVAAAESDFA
jgi:hypothetical protein